MIGRIVLAALIPGAMIPTTLIPDAAMAQTAPAPLERPLIAAPSAPRVSPLPTAPLAGIRFVPPVDYQAILGAAAESPDAVVLLRDRETGAIDELGIRQFLGIPPEYLDDGRYEIRLVDRAARSATTLPFVEFRTFSDAHPEYGGETASVDPGAGWMPVRRAFFDPLSGPPEAAYHVILVAGPGLAGDPRMLSAGQALCGQPEFDDTENLDPDRLAVVAAPIARVLEDGDKVSLAADYDHDRAARWLDTLTGTFLGREAAARLDRNAFGFIAAATDPTPGLDAARPEDFDAADAIYIDLAAISPGYVEEVVARIVKGMHEGNAVSHTGAIGVLEAFSLVERVGAATLRIAGLLEPSTARAAPSGEGC